MRAFIFPGQGSQSVGMGRESYLGDSQIRDIVNRANDVLGRQLSGIMFEGPEEELRQTINAQPAIFLHSYFVYQMLEEPAPAMAAGHSLGEYTALTAANVLTFDDALKLVQLRAESMQEAGTMSQGTMAAIIGMEDQAVVELCGEVSASSGVVVAANFNAPGQVVVSGSVEGVTEAMRVAKERGARMAKQLNVSGAFHSPLMEPAREKLAEALAATHFSNGEFPVYVNVSARPLTNGEEIREALLRQLTAPVLWTETIGAMRGDGASEFIEVGPGNVLQGLVKRIAPEAATSGIESLEQIEQFNTQNA